MGWYIWRKWNCQWRILYPEQLLFRNGEEIKNFQDKLKLKEFIITRPRLEELVKKVIPLETKGFETVSWRYEKI